MMVDKQQTKAESAPESNAVAVPAISDEEYFRRTKLDVSDPAYINPSYDR